MYKKIVCICLCLCLTGCGNSDKENEASTEEEIVTSQDLAYNQDNIKQDKLATREFIIEYFDLNEDDIKHIDVEAVIEYYQITEEGIKSSSNVVAKLEMLEEQMKDEAGKMGDFSYLLEGESASGDIKKEDIKYIAYLRGENDRNDVWLIDIDNNKVYYFLGETALIEPENADKEADLDVDDLDNILISIEDGKLNNWKPIYEGDNGDTTGSAGWRLGIQLNDGTVISYRGWGMFGENRPQELDEIEGYITSVNLDK